MTAPPPLGRSWAVRLPSWRKVRDNTTEPPFDATSWTGALVVMLAVAAVPWLVQIVNVAEHYSLNQFGLRPRRLDGLWGVLAAPLLHQSWGQLGSDTVSVVLIGWVLLLAGVRSWLTVSAIVLVVGGLLTWLVAPSGELVGASGIVFGWLGYLIARAYFSRKIRWILVAAFVVFFFGGLLLGLLPTFGAHVPWQAHGSGFAAGILAGAVLHPRRARRPEAVGPTGPAVS